VQFTTMDQFPLGGAEIEGNLLQAQWREAGFDITANPTAIDVLFDDMAPNGKFSTISYFNLPSTSSPSDRWQWCSQNILPAGQAWSRLRSPTVDDLFHKIATELDDARRHTPVAEAQQDLADEIPGLPLAAAPTVGSGGDALVPGARPWVSWGRASQERRRKGVLRVPPRPGDAVGR
jgi:ABC-type transport system substrate-binding protein